MSAVFRTIADELVAALAGASFSIQISPATSWQTELNLAALSTLTVAVIRQALALEPGDRAGDLADYRLNVMVAKRIDPRQSEAQTLDPLEDMADEILDFVAGTALATAGKPVKCEQEQIFDPKALQEKHVFLSVITPTYRLLRTQP
jgi:hypothetical protein